VSEHANDVVVRVEDASLVEVGGPAWFVVTGLLSPASVAERAATAGAVVQVDQGRLRALMTPQQLINAAGRVDPGLGRALEAAVGPVVANWSTVVRQVPVAGGHLDGTARPLVMGIVNVTPDSFSDGGSAYDPDDHPGRAVAHARALVDAGADLVDVGGESTRPGADPVDLDQELARVLPVVEALAGDVAVSIDTTKAAVARAAVEAGAVLVNDVSAGALDDAMLPTVAELDCGYVLMHMQGTPQTMQDDPTYTDVVADVYEFLARGLDRLEAAGVGRDRVTVDPGIGFGKTSDHNHALLANLRQFAGLGVPMMVGTSRKSFLRTDDAHADPATRIPGSVASATASILAGAAMVRVHDVADTRHAADVALRIAQAARR
jgi:dihydropteroate synthase